MRVPRHTFLSMCCLLAASSQALPAQTATFFPRVSKPLESAWTIAADSTGVYAAGEVRQRPDVQDGTRAYVRKFDAYGAELWTRQFDGTSAATGVASAASGIYVAGNAYIGSDSNSGRELFLRKYDPDGNELWTWQSGRPIEVIAASGALAADDAGVYLLEPNLEHASTQVLRRFDEGGQQLWSLVVSYAWTLSADATGLYLIDRAPAYQMTHLRKFNRAGVQLWTRTLRNDVLGYFAANSDGIYMTTVLYSSTDERLHRYFQAYDANGNLKWTREYPVEFQEPPGGVIVAGDDGFYFAISANGTLDGQCRAGYLDFVVSRFDSQGNRLWKRQLGSDQDDFPSAIAVGPAGVYVTGGPYGPLAMIARLDKEPEAPSSAPRIHHECVLNAANYVGGGIAPGEMVTILGTSLGPPEGMQAHASQDSPLPAALGNARVLFNGVPGALLYASDRQTTVIVPYALAGQTRVEVRVEYTGELSNAVLLPLKETRLGLFSADGSGQGPAAAWNEDGTLNSPDNPALTGSVVTFYATGAPLENQFSEAKVVTSPAPAVKAEVQVAFSGPYPEAGWNWDDARIIRYAPLSAGGVAGSVSGLIQIKLRLPGMGWDFGSGIWYPQLMTLTDSIASSLATIAVKSR